MNFILDNLLAAGKAKPMLVVMDQGYATKVGTKSGNAFEEAALSDLIPAVDAEYRTRAGRDHRAVAGLSMGAGQALQIGLTHLDQFSDIGAFSGAGREFDVQTSFGGVFKDAATFNKKVKLLWIGAGTAEEGVFKSSKASRIAFRCSASDHNVRMRSLASRSILPSPRTAFSISEHRLSSNKPTFGSASVRSDWQSRTIVRYDTGTRSSGCVSRGKANRP